MDQKNNWSSSDSAQRKRTIKFLKEVIETLEEQEAEKDAAKAAEKKTATKKATRTKTPSATK